jgi:predicted ester cyclase
MRLLQCWLVASTGTLTQFNPNREKIMKLRILALVAGLALPFPLHAQDTAMTQKTTLTDRAFEYRVAGYRICLSFLAEDRLRWTYLEAPGGEVGKTAEERFDRRDLRSELVMASWTEKSGANVTDVFDFSHGMLHASFVMPDGKRFMSDAPIVEKTACGSHSANRVGPITNEDVARILYAAFNNKDLSVFDKIMAEDLLNHPMAPGSDPGRAGMKVSIAHFFENVPDFSVEIQDVITGDGKTVVRSIARGTPKAGLFGFSTNGGVFEIETADILAIQDGRITEIWHLENWFSALMQLGAVKPGS